MCINFNFKTLTYQKNHKSWIRSWDLSRSIELVFLIPNHPLTFSEDFMVSILNRFTISIELRSAGRSDYLMIDYRLSGAKSVPRRTKGEPKGSQMGAKRLPREPRGCQGSQGVKRVPPKKKECSNHSPCAAKSSQWYKMIGGRGVPHPGLILLYIIWLLFPPP